MLAYLVVNPGQRLKEYMAVGDGRGES